MAVKITSRDFKRARPGGFKFDVGRWREFGVGLAVGLSGGYKVFTNDPPSEDRALDLALNLSLAIPFDDTYITPQLHAAYVTRDEDVVPDATFSDSFIAWVGVHVGYNAGL